MNRSQEIQVQNLDHLGLVAGIVDQVESQVRREADLRRLEKNRDKSEREANKKLQRLCNQKFASSQAAIEVTQRFAQKLKYHKLTDIQAVERLPDPTKKAIVK